MAPTKIAERLRESPSPAPEQVLQLQRSIGNQGVATLLRDEQALGGERTRPSGDEQQDRHVAPETVPEAAPAAPAVQVAAAAPAVQVAAADQGPVIQRAGGADTATIPTSRDAIGEVMEGWYLVQRLLGELEFQTRTIFDDAVDTATQKKKKKQVKKLTTARREARTELEAISRAAFAAFWEAFKCEWDIEAGRTDSAGKIPALQAVVADTLTQLTRGLMDGAKFAHAHGDRRRAGLFTGLAEEAEQAGGALDHGGGSQETATTGKDVLGTVTTVADLGNNVGPGVVGGGIGGYEAFGAAFHGMDAISSASTAVGGVFAGLGIVFGSIGIGLGANAWRHGASSERELDALAPTLDNDELVDATKYASAKKYRKKNRGKAGVLSGGLAVTAGGVALFAIAFSFLGPGAAILGVGAALIGIGFLVGRYLHKRSKRKAYAKTLATETMNALNDDTNPAAQAEAQAALESYGIDHTAQADKATKAALEKAFRAAGESRRKDTARTIYEALVGKDVSSQIDAERVLEALHLDHADVRALTPKDAVDAIAGKMASW